MPEKGKEYPGKMTVFVFLACLVASSGGLIFGYDIGISGKYILIIHRPWIDGSVVDRVRSATHELRSPDDERRNPMLQAA